MTALPVARLEHRRIGVPGREGGAGEAHRHTAWHQPIALAQPQGRRAEAALPEGLGRHVRHGRLCVGERLHAAVERVGAAARVAHQSTLAGRVHHRLRAQEHVGVQALDDLHAHAEARVRRGRGPAGHCPPGRREQGVRVATRIVDAERLAGVGRDLVADAVDGAGLLELEGPAELGAKRCRRGLPRRLAAGVAVGCLLEQAEPAALEAGAPCRLQRACVLLEEPECCRVRRVHALSCSFGRGRCHLPVPEAARRHTSRCRRVPLRTSSDAESVST